MDRKRSVIVTVTAVLSVVIGALAGSLLGDHSLALAQPVIPLVTTLDEPKVQAHKFYLRDEEGRALATLATGDEAPALKLFDIWGEHRAEIGVNDDAEACLNLFPETGSASFAAAVPETTPTYAIVYNPDSSIAWSVPEFEQPATPAGAISDIPPITPDPGPEPPTQSLEYDEVQALEFIARDMEKKRSIHLYTSTEGGYPRAIFFDRIYQAPRAMLSVNEGGEADIRLLDRMGKIRLLFIAAPDAAGWALFDHEGKPQWGFLTSQSMDFPAVAIPGDR